MCKVPVAKRSLASQNRKDIHVAGAEGVPAACSGRALAMWERPIRPMQSGQSCAAESMKGRHPLGIVSQHGDFQ